MIRPQDHVKNVLDRLMTKGLNAHHVEIAYRHAEEWVSASPPPNSCRSEPDESEMDEAPTFNPRTAEEAQEIRRVNALALRGLTEIPRLAQLLDDTARDLHALTQRLTALDLSKLDGETWCKHHKLHGMNEPLGSRPRAGNCGFCDDFRRSEGALPPLAVLDARGRGERITARLVAESLGRKAS